MARKFDLHTHSFFSGDGVSRPEDLIAAAWGKGLHGIAITDHNTCDALPTCSKKV
jgi:predicted metal-dependent phosphoesterase TrpH